MIPFSDSRPPKTGDVLFYRGEPKGIVHSTAGNLCWFHPVDNLMTTVPFVWRFRNGSANPLYEVKQ